MKFEEWESGFDITFQGTDTPKEKRIVLAMIELMKAIITRE